MTFYEGQEVEVSSRVAISPHSRVFETVWRKAKICGPTMYDPADDPCYVVEFPNGASAVFDEGHIRALSR